MKTYTICGSMRFEREMQEIAFRLETQRGFNILQCTYAAEEVSEAEKQRLVSAHYRKIDLSDGIYVVNVGGYIGESVAAEIAYAKKQGKEVLYHCRVCGNAAHQSLPLHTGALGAPVPVHKNDLLISQEVKFVK